MSLPATAGAVAGIPVAGVQQTTSHTFTVNREDGNAGLHPDRWGTKIPLIGAPRGAMSPAGHAQPRCAAINVEWVSGQEVFRQYGVVVTRRLSRVCRIPKSGAITQEVQETPRDQDGLRKWTVSQPAVGGPYIRMGRRLTPRVRGLPAMVPLSESLLVSILTLTKKSNALEALCV